MCYQSSDVFDNISMHTKNIICRYLLCIGSQLLPVGFYFLPFIGGTQYFTQTKFNRFNLLHGFCYIFFNRR